MIMEVPDTVEVVVAVELVCCNEAGREMMVIRVQTHLDLCAGQVVPLA